LFGSILSPKNCQKLNEKNPSEKQMKTRTRVTSSDERTSQVKSSKEEKRKERALLVEDDQVLLSRD